MPRSQAMPCPPEEKLAAFFGGHLSCDEIPGVEEHLSRCGHCRKAFAAIGSRSQSVAAPGRAPDAGASLSEGMEAGRYVVRELIGAGAMGAVYAAYDPELRRDVAIKVLRDRENDPSNAARTARMRREARAMARLSHPNVMTVHDVGTVDGRTFVAMDLVRGGTLREWLRAREHALAEIVEVLVRAGRGLAAAHRAGLVHRDFKPDNVLVDDDGRVLVTDFGLVRLPEEGEEEAGVDSHLPASMSLTGAGSVVGTPAYMAPEQHEGRPADARSDVFAFCVTAYEALYGERPFAAPHAELLEAIRTGRVREAPKGSRVPGSLRRALLDGLHPDPQARPASMDVLLPELERRRGRPWLRVTAAVAGLVLVASLGIALTRASRAPVALDAAAAGMRPAIAVLPLRPGADEPGARGLVIAVADALRGPLAAGGAMRSPSNDEVASAATELAIDASLEGNALARQLAALRVDYVVSGALETGPGGRVTVRAKVLRVATGEVVADTEASGSSSETLELAWRAAVELRRKMGAPPASAESLQQARAALPSGELAARAYAEGVDALRTHDVAGARGRFERAAELAPDSSAVHSALARTLDVLGFDERASEEAQRALELAARLSHEDRLIAAWARDLSLRDWNRATTSCRALSSLYPDRLDYALGLLEVQRRSTSYDAGEETLAAIRRLPAPLATDPQVDLAEAALAWAHGDAQRALAAADAARSKAAASGGARALVVRAILQRSLAEGRLGERARAEDDLGVAARLATERGDESDAARARDYLAQLRVEESRFDEAAALLEESLAGYERRGREGRVAETLATMAALERRRGDDRAARRRYEDALAHDLFREGHRREIAATRTSLGELLAEMGELSLASEQHEAALALRRELRSGMGEAESLVALSHVDLARGDVTAARERAEAALARAVAANAHLREGAAREALAEVLVERGEASAARSAFEQACGALQKEGSSLEASCRARYATALGAWGSPLDALTQVDRAETVAAANDAWPARREVDIEAARARAAGGAGARASSRAKLTALVAEAERAGATRDALEASLALGQVELGDGHAAGGRARLTRVARDATAKGLVSLARRATASIRYLLQQ